VQKQKQHEAQNGAGALALHLQWGQLSPEKAPLPDNKLRRETRGAKMKITQHISGGSSRVSTQNLLACSSCSS
jgi:hypothetical protein